MSPTPPPWRRSRRWSCGRRRGVAVGLAVGEIQRIVRDVRQGEGLAAAVVEGVGEAQRRADAHVAAGRGDPQRRLQVRPVDHLAGVGAFDPQVVRRLAAWSTSLRTPGAICASQPPRSRAALGVGCFLRRQAMALAFSRRCAARAGAQPGRGPRRSPALSRPDHAFCAHGSAMASTRAEPTTTPSAIAGDAAACSGVRMPKPTATGRPLAARARATAGATAPASAALPRSPRRPRHSRQSREVRRPPPAGARRRWWAWPGGSGRGLRVQGVGQRRGLFRRAVDDDQRRRRRPPPRPPRSARSPGSAAG